MQQQDAVEIGATKRTFDIIQYVKERGPVGVSSVADELDMPTSTANDYLQSLTTLGFLQRVDGGYRLGLRFLELGESARSDREVVSVGLQEVDRLATQTGEHANMLIEENGRGIFVYKATGENAVRLDTHPGMVVHLHTTALGKAMLAHMDQDRVREIIETHGLPAVTEKTIDSEEALYEELDVIREQGYARDDEERVKGMRCLAAPVLFEGEVVAAVSASGPVTRFQGEAFETEIPNQVKSTANVIEVNMTHS